MSKQQNGVMQSEQELIKGCAEGNRASQKALYDRYCHKMMAICLRYARSTAEAEDILQEGFVRVFANLKNFRSESRLETWITRIMINSALNQNRQKLYLLPLVDVNEMSIQETEDISLAHFNFSELVLVVQSLPDGCKMVFNLFAIEGYGHKEIASMMNISEGTSKSQYNRAKLLLRTKLSELEKEYGRYGRK